MNSDQIHNFFSLCVKNPSKYHISVPEWFWTVTDNTENESANAAALSDCNKLVGQEFNNPCKSLQN